MKTIARSRKKFIAKLATQYTDCREYDASSGNVIPAPASKAWDALNQYPHARLTESSDGTTYTVHVHSSHWYKLTAPETVKPTEPMAEQTTAAQPKQSPEDKRAEIRTDYIVGCIREGGSMYTEDARNYLAEHDAHRRTKVLAEAKTEVVAWLAKKATEQQTWDAAVLASKVDRGAVRIFLGTDHYQDAKDAHRADVLAEAGGYVRTVAAQLGFPLDIVNMLCEDLDGANAGKATDLAQAPDADDEVMQAVRRVIADFPFSIYGIEIDDVDPAWVGDLASAIAGALDDQTEEDTPRG
jgi:hypothetical protein